MSRAGQNAAFTAEQIDAHAPKLQKHHLDILRAVATGATYTQLAEGLRLPGGTVRSRLNRARVALNAAINKEGVAP